jgi:hypothetical protein
LKKARGNLIVSGTTTGDEPSFELKQATISPAGTKTITMGANDRFVAVFE